MDYKKEKAIRKWLKKYGVTNYTLIEDKEHGFVVDVNEDVSLHYKKLDEIQIQFNVVKGSFDCSFNQLKSLKGVPKIVEGDFNCRGNDLINLNFSPSEVGGDFSCLQNSLVSLEGAPLKIGKNFNCSHNQLRSIKFLPREIGGDTLIISNKNIRHLNLEDLPEIFKGEVWLNDNPLSNKDIENNKNYKIHEIFSILERKKLEKEINNQKIKKINKI